MKVLRTLTYIWNHPITSRQRCHAVCRYFRWQFSSRFAMGKIVYPWIEGSRFVAGPGEMGLTGNIYTGLHEFEEMSFVMHALRPGDLFFDVGANVGEYTILACAVSGAQAICFEPIPDTFKRLQLNLAVNHLEGIAKAVNCGLGKEPGTLKFTTGLDSMNHAVAEGEDSANAVEVPVKPLDSFAEDRAPFLLKIDVEGFEMSVLAGATKILASPSLQAIIIEMNGSGLRYGYDDAEIHSLLQQNGFQYVVYDPFKRTLRPGGDAEAGVNRIYVRDLQTVTERVTTARRFQVGKVAL